MITISLPNVTAAVLGTYQVDAVFSAPGVYTFSLGLSVTVFDACATSTFATGPILTPSVLSYYLEQGNY